MKRKRVLAAIAAATLVLGILLVGTGCSNKIFDDYESETFELGGAGTSSIA